MVALSVDNLSRKPGISFWVFEANSLSAIEGTVMGDWWSRFSVPLGQLFVKRVTKRMCTDFPEE